MQEITLLTADGLAGTIFLNYITKSKIHIKKIFLISHIKGGVFSKIKKGIDLIRKKSALFLFYKFIFEKIVFKMLYIDGKNIKSIKQIAKENNLNVEAVNNVNKESFIKKFENEPSLVISAYGSQIFNKKLISKTKNFWNVHGSYLPYFKGAAPYFWMLLIKKYPKGVTLHNVEEKLDAGIIIRQQIVDPKSGESLFLYHTRCVLRAAEMFCDVMLKNEKMTRKISKEKIPTEKYGLPTRKDMKNFKKAGKRLFYWKDYTKIKKMFNKQALP